MIRIFSVFLLVIITVKISDALIGLGRKQSIAVTGRVTCNGVPAKDIKIKLYEKENLKDIKLDEVRTEADGSFRVWGAKTEITNIDPKVNIYHRCNYIGVCYQKVGITIPDSFISIGGTPKKTYDIGQLNLANKFSGQTTDCIN